MDKIYYPGLVAAVLITLGGIFILQRMLREVEELEAKLQAQQVRLYDFRGHRLNMVPRIPQLVPTDGVIWVIRKITSTKSNGNNDVILTKNDLLTDSSFFADIEAANRCAVSKPSDSPLHTIPRSLRCENPTI
jgi:hypothetical protein